MTSSNSSKGGFGPIALIVAGVVCFAAGYMVNDLTKALTQSVPEPKPGALRSPPAPREEQPTLPDGGIEAPADAPGATTDEKKPEDQKPPAGEPAAQPPAPPAGAGAPPPKP
ncbi:MAG: hypothetical protein ACKVZJ_09820 [Phycisphaerales bacterium]